MLAVKQGKRGYNGDKRHNREESGRKDITEKNLEECNDVFADIANVLLFRGRRVIQEKDLENSPARTMYKVDDDKVHEQERDIRFAFFGKSCRACKPLRGRI